MEGTISGSALRPVRYRVPASMGRAEYVARNSLFIGTVAPAADLDVAHCAVRDIRAEYPDAHHHAWAYRGAGQDLSALASSDDGEPGGTAGRPMLGVLEGSGLQQVIAIGTRYFGGVKLGMGGLVRAYSQCIREALRGVAVREFVLHRLARVTLAYDQYGAVKRLLPKASVRLDAEQFADHIEMAIAVPYERVPELSVFLSDLTAGRVRLEACWTGERYDTEVAPSG